MAHPLKQGYGDISPNSIMVDEPLDFVLFEGWCLGLPTFSSAELKHICQKYRIDLQRLDPRGRSK